MFSALKRLLGNITVHVKNDVVFVEGVEGDVMAKDIKTIWGTNKINAHMFVHMDSSSFSFPSFFLPDMLYTLEQMTQNHSLKISVRTLIKIKDLLMENTWLAETLKEPYSKLDMSKLKDLKLTPLDFQDEFFKIYDKLTGQYALNGFLFAGAAGSGKAQPLDAGIKVPGGWKTMGDMHVGQEVIAKDGTVTSVTAVYPQGRKEIFRVTFTDGRYTECCAEHLWAITRQKRRDQHFREVVNTASIQKYLQTSTLHNRLFVDLAEPEDGTEKSLLIDPYVLGAYLGDGSTARLTPCITTPDSFLVEEIARHLPETMKLVLIPSSTAGGKCPSYSVLAKNSNEKGNPFAEALMQLGLHGKLSWDKFIPSEYFDGSKVQKLSLLQGLLDTDGTVDAQGTVSFCSTSEHLALGVQYLVRSLGGIAAIAVKTPHFTYLGERKQGRLAYQINIRYKVPSELFRLPKKKERTKDAGQYNQHLKLRIDKIESVGFKEAQCISIAHPDKLYVTDDFIVTHNTFTALALGHCLDVDRVIIVCPKNAVELVWKKNIDTHFHKPKSYWLSTTGQPFKGDEHYVIGHYETLEQISEIAKTFRNENVMIVLDESHNFNGMTSLRTSRFVQLCKDTDSREVLWLSGTPIKALAVEAIPLFRCIDPLFTEDVEKRFKKIYGDDKGRGVDILKNRMGIVSFKVEKKRLGLAPPIMMDLRVKIPNGQDYTLKAIKEVMLQFITERASYYKGRKSGDEQLFNRCLGLYEKTLRSPQDKQGYVEYREALQKVIKTQGAFEVKDEMMLCNKYELGKITPQLPQELRAEWKNVRSIIKYVHLKIQGECLGRIVGGLRIQCHVDMVESVDFKAVCQSTEKKTVVFTTFTSVIAKCEKYLPTLGLSPLFVYGKTNGNLRATVDTFAREEDANPMVATYASLSTAVPLVMADTMILIDSPFRDYIVQQAISRIHRLDSDTQTYVYTVALDTGEETNISSRSMDILKWSQEQIEKITGVSAPFLIGENLLGDGFEGLTSALEGFDTEALESVKHLKPSFLSW